MNHTEFVEGVRNGKVRVDIDPAAAAAFLSARLLLPFVGVAVMGLGIALVLWGWTWSGFGVGTFGIVVPRLIKRGARGFLLTHIEGDPALYQHAVEAGALRVVAASDPTQSPGVR